MLTHIEACNFKSWRSFSLDLAPVTGLFGLNSSGKTSILQLLLMLKQTKEATDRSLALDFGGPRPNSYVNLGSFQDAIFQHELSNALSWKIGWRLNQPLAIADPDRPKSDAPLFSSDRLNVEAQVSLSGKQPSTDKLVYAIGEQKFSLVRKENRPSAFLIDSSGADTHFRFTRKQGRAWDIPGPIKSYAFPDQAKTYLQNASFLSDLEFAYEKLMDNVFYLGPLREYPKREYIWSGASPMDVGQRGERVVDAILAARARGLKHNLGPRRRYQPFEAIIAHWLKALGLIDSFQVEEIGKDSNLYKVEVIKTRGAPKVLIPDVGFGVSQILPVLVLLYYVPEGSTVLLEQPEIHLHPAVQSGLADVILNVAKNRGVQIVVESHSEHLLRRLQRRIAEAENGVGPDDVALYFCANRGGQSSLTPLELDLYGSILNWPEGFFGDEFGELAAMQEAGLRRRIAEGASAKNN